MICQVVALVPRLIPRTNCEKGINACKLSSDIHMQTVLMCT